MEILAFGVQADEKPLIERAFAPHHPVRTLDVFLNTDTAPIAAGHEIISTSVNCDLGADVLSGLAAGGTRMVAQRSTGFNNVDLDVAARLGITVARVSSYSPYSVAEFAWTLAMAVNRRIVRASTRTRDFDFRLDGLMGRDLHGRTAGILGTGKIGEAFARIAHGFGMRLLGWDAAENPACRELGLTYVPKEELLAESDLVSLHVPLLPETRHLIDATALKSMRDDAILVNSSRAAWSTPPRSSTNCAPAASPASAWTCTRRRRACSSSTSPWRPSTTTPWPASSPSPTSWSRPTRRTTPRTRSPRSSPRRWTTSSTTLPAAARGTCWCRAADRSAPAPRPPRSG
ncbi:Formate dehydrogenase, mitochondrial [Streptomyces griseoloalbus]